MAEETKKRRKKGSGSIIKLSNGKFRSELKYTDAFGNPQVLRDTVNTKTEAERNLKRYQKTVEQIRKAMTLDITKITVEKYFTEIFLPHKARTVGADSTYKRIVSTIKTHIMAEHGYKILMQITSKDINDLLDKKKEDGLGHSSIKKIHDAYNEMFEYAIARNDIAITENPMKLAPMISQKRFEQSEVKYFNYEETSAFVEAALTKYSTGNYVYRYGPVFVFLINTGLRVGELCALTKNDVNLEKRTISINHGLSDKRYVEDGVEKYKKTINSTKRLNSVRVVPMNDEALKYAKIIFELHNESNTMFICTHKGEIVQPGTINKQMLSVLSRAGIERCGPHTLRHTFVSILFDKGVDIHTIANLIGDDEATVKKTYLHLFQERKARAIELTNIT